MRRALSLLATGFLISGCASRAVMPQPQVQPTARTNTLAMSAREVPQATAPFSYDRLNSLGLIAVPLAQNKEVYVAGVKIAPECLEGVIGLPAEHYKRIIKGEETDQTVTFVPRGDQELYALMNVIKEPNGKIVPNTGKPETLELYAEGATRTLAPRTRNLVERVDVSKINFKWKEVTIDGKQYYEIPVFLVPPKPGQRIDPRQNTLYVRIAKETEKWTETRTEENVENDRHYLRGDANMFINAELKDKPLPPAPKFPTPEEIKAKQEAEKKAIEQRAIQIEIDKHKGTVIVK